MSLTYGFCLDDPSGVYGSAQFSDAIHALVGDGIAQYGARLALTLNGFTATVSSGYALAAGRWIENDEPLSLTMQPSGNNEDRTDAIAAQVDYPAKRAALTVLSDVDVDKLSADPNTGRSDTEYIILLYLIRVPRGATTILPEYVTDLRENPSICGAVLPLSAISGDVLYVYQFLHSGIDKEVNRIISLSKVLADKADAEIAALDAAIQKAGGGPSVGDLQTVRRVPADSGWLLCDGGMVPVECKELSDLIGSTLPDISRGEDRYRTYIYTGAA